MTYRIINQTYGLAMPQNRFGGASGVWLECQTCPKSHKLVGITCDETEGLHDMPIKMVGKIFKEFGWTGQGPALKGAQCPDCSSRVKAA